MYYECHVTLPPKDRELVDSIAKFHRFKTSSLVGDEIMGDDKLLYCTSHSKTYDELSQRMDALVENLTENGVEILREKIEHIIYDTKVRKEDIS